MASCDKFVIITIFLSLVTSMNATIVSTHYPREHWNKNLKCEDGESCTIICDKKHSCHGSIISCATDSNCSIICNEYASCVYSTITCSIDQPCNISCIGEISCHKMYVEWPMIDGYGVVTCDSYMACSGLDFPIPDPNKQYNIECNSQNECERTDINCPGNADCNITCSEYDSCFEATIKCPVNGDCNVVCSANNSCESTNIICPSNGNCNISCLNSSNSCNGINILWSNISTNIGTLYCDPIDECYDIIQPPVHHHQSITYPSNIVNITVPTTDCLNNDMFVLQDISYEILRIFKWDKSENIIYNDTSQTYTNIISNSGSQCNDIMNGNYLVQIAKMMVIVFVIFNLFCVLYCVYGKVSNRKRPNYINIYRNIDAI